MEQAQWFYATGNVQQGPVDAATLRQLIAAGQVGVNDLVWKDGMADWVPASTIAELVAPPPMAPPPGNGGVAQDTYAAGGTYVPPAPGLGYQPPVAEGGGMATAAMVLGIISIPGSCICIGLITGILAIIFALQNKNPMFASKAKVGLICGIIGVALSLGWTGLSLIGNLSKM